MTAHNDAYICENIACFLLLSSGSQTMDCYHQLLGAVFFFFFPLQIFSELYVANGTFSLTTKVKDQVYITANWEYNFRTAILKLLVLENWPPNKELYIYFMCTL